MSVSAVDTVPSKSSGKQEGEKLLRERANAANVSGRPNGSQLLRERAKG